MAKRKGGARRPKSLTIRGGPQPPVGPEREPARLVPDGIRESYSRPFGQKGPNIPGARGIGIQRASRVISPTKEAKRSDLFRRIV